MTKTYLQIIYLQMIVLMWKQYICNALSEMNNFELNSIEKWFLKTRVIAP